MQHSRWLNIDLQSLCSLCNCSSGVGTLPSCHAPLYHLQLGLIMGKGCGGGVAFKANPTWDSEIGTLSHNIWSQEGSKGQQWDNCLTASEITPGWYPSELSISSEQCKQNKHFECTWLYVWRTLTEAMSPTQRLDSFAQSVIRISSYSVQLHQPRNLTSNLTCLLRYD